VRAWSQAYRNDGLVVIGVHTPEFSFENEIDRIRRATTERGNGYPVAVDNDYAIWKAFDNHYWPALYFVEADNVIRDHHFGEGRYLQSERVIQRLLGVEREFDSVEGLGVEAEADWDHLRTPETYLGSTTRAPERVIDHHADQMTDGTGPDSAATGSRRSWLSSTVAQVRGVGGRRRRGRYDPPGSPEPAPPLSSHPTREDRAGHPPGTPRPDVSAARNAEGRHTQ
jgi:hypothetical protein